MISEAFHLFLYDFGGLLYDLWMSCCSNDPPNDPPLNQAARHVAAILKNKYPSELVRSYVLRFICYLISVWPF